MLEGKLLYYLIYKITKAGNKKVINYIWLENMEIYLTLVRTNLKFRTNLK